jgi:hypothetical protein
MNPKFMPRETFPELHPFRDLLDAAAVAGDRMSAIKIAKEIEDLAAVQVGYAAIQKEARRRIGNMPPGRYPIGHGPGWPSVEEQLDRHREADALVLTWELHGIAAEEANQFRLGRRDWPWPHQLYRLIAHEIYYAFHWVGVEHDEDGRVIPGTGRCVDSPASYPSAWDAYRASFRRRLNEYKQPLLRLHICLRGMQFAQGICQRDGITEQWAVREEYAKWYEVHLDSGGLDMAAAGITIPAEKFT